MSFSVFLRRHGLRLVERATETFVTHVTALRLYGEPAREIGMLVCRTPRADRGVASFDVPTVKLNDFAGSCRCVGFFFALFGWLEFLLEPFAQRDRQRDGDAKAQNEHAEHDERVYPKLWIHHSPSLVSRCRRSIPAQRALEQRTDHECNHDWESDSSSQDRCNEQNVV